jgi:hypothetical protein
MAMTLGVGLAFKSDPGSKPKVFVMLDLESKYPVQQHRGHSSLSSIITEWSSPPSPNLSPLMSSQPRNPGKRRACEKSCSFPGGTLD